jgi:hypothetical protein
VNARVENDSAAPPSGGMAREPVRKSMENDEVQAKDDAYQMGVCFDCGNAPQWPRGNSEFCKRCHDKNGHPTALAVDLDRLYELAGEELGAKLEGAGAHVGGFVASAARIMADNAAITSWEHHEGDRPSRLVVRDHRTLVSGPDKSQKR